MVLAMNVSNTSERPFFSVVMPAYNASAFIAEAIESVIAQTFPDWELIITDDCSTDDTSSIASRYAAIDPRIKLLRTAQNSGNAYQPRKSAILASSGKYIAPLDADDTIEPEFLEKMHIRISETAADKVYCKLVREKNVLPVPGFDTSRIYAGKELLRHTLNGWKIAPNGCVTRELYMQIFKKNGIQSASMNADELMSRQLMVAAEKIAFCDASYHYRANPDSVSNRIDQSRFEILNTNVDLKKFVYENFPYESDERILINKQLFDDIVGLITFWGMYRDKLKSHDKKIMSLLNEARQSIDWSLLKGKVSTSKMYLLKAGILPLKYASVIHGRFKRRK